MCNYAQHFQTMYSSDSDYLTKPFFTCQQGDVKSLMKTSRLHIIVIEP